MMNIIITGKNMEIGDVLLVGAFVLDVSTPPGCGITCSGSGWLSQPDFEAARYVLCENPATAPDVGNRH